MIVLFYETRAGCIGRDLDLGLDVAVAMLREVLACSSIDPGGVWYYERTTH